VGEHQPLTAAEQLERREWFRRHLQTNIPFNALCGFEMLRWDADGVEFGLPYAGRLSAHPGVLHGGVLAALIDTTGAAAVFAGHDFTRGSRLSTVALSVQYLAVAAGEDVLATGHCTKRGRLVHVADIAVTGATSGACWQPDRSPRPSTASARDFSGRYRARPRPGRRENRGPEPPPTRCGGVPHRGARDPRPGAARGLDRHRV
jgi:uncharacterized protein (TIGR00369 family)